MPVLLRIISAPSLPVIVIVNAELFKNAQMMSKEQNTDIIIEQAQ